MALVPQGGCGAVFEPIAWKEGTEEVPPDLVTAKYEEFCKNEGGEKPNKIGFLGTQLGPCEGATCDCRKNEVCDELEGNFVDSGNAKKLTITGSTKQMPRKGYQFHFIGIFTHCTFLHCHAISDRQ